jgi:hypothetical protein
VPLTLPRIASLALCAGLIACPAALAQPPEAGRLPVLTAIKAIRELSQDQGAQGYPVRIRGIVTHFDEQADVTLIVHDGQFGQFVVNPPNPAAAGPWRSLRRGDLIEIEGRTVRGGFAPNVEPVTVRRIAQASLPEPRNIAFAAMVTGRHDCD